MQRTVFQSVEPPFRWLDVVDPTPSELHALAREYGLHPTSVQDCLDPEHLPKYEPIAGTTFIIVRAWDREAPPDAVTVQQGTRKVAIFCAEQLVLTIHRTEQAYLTAIMERYATALPPETPAEARRNFTSRILVDLLNGAVQTFERPLEEVEVRADEFEGTLFGRADVTELLRDMHVVKRRVLLIRRMLWHTLAVLGRLTAPEDRAKPLFHDLRENGESMHAYADELLEELTSLLSIHLALASHRTNEVVRVLTVFSVFFLPLTFVVGVYGMNFRYMPELTHRWGYPMVILLMVMVTGAIFLWFRHRGWLRL